MKTRFNWLTLFLVCAATPAWAVDWDINFIKNVVGESENGRKDFTAKFGDLGDEHGKVGYIRVTKANRIKTGDDFNGSWRGKISFDFSDGAGTGSYDCKLENDFKNDLVFKCK